MNRVAQFRRRALPHLRRVIHAAQDHACFTVATFTPQGSLTSLTTDWLRRRDKSHADPLDRSSWVPQ